MRKLLLIAMLVLSTLAWARGKELQTQRTGGDWYSQKLGVQVDQFTLINATQSPSATAFAEQENFSGPLPGSMASNRAMQNEDWYNQKVAIQAEVGRRDLASNKNRL